MTRKTGLLRRSGNRRLRLDSLGVTYKRRRTSDEDLGDRSHSSVEERRVS